MRRKGQGFKISDGMTCGTLLPLGIVRLVVLVHHTGKDTTKGLRGHSSLFAALDAAVEVSHDGDRRQWKVAKSKDGQDREPCNYCRHRPRVCARASFLTVPRSTRGHVSASVCARARGNGTAPGK